MTTLYGIGNCGTCRQARRWLEVAGVEFEWRDFDRHPVDAGTVDDWLARTNAETVLNKRSKAWRDLDEQTRAAVQKAPAGWAADNPRLIKRPVLDTGRELVIGYDEARYAELFGEQTQ